MELDINKITREDFMSFFRDDEKLNTLSTDERIEIWETVMIGSSDFTVERVQAVLNDYSTGLLVTDLKEDDIVSLKCPSWSNENFTCEGGCE